ncbi:MAG: nuclear transport factor 2 family protein [Rhodothermaceae bacterium]|nr:nuclear transport factor 2 family protein [Rhodothermaceae bacterium]
MQNRQITLLIAFLVCLFVCLGCTETVQPPPINTQAEASQIRALLDAQVGDWNAGDIEAFMQSYWKSDSLRFASGNGVREGWQETLERYKTTYPDKANMGELTFELYDVSVLSASAATVFGRFNLKREAPLEDLTGLFTLILRKKDGVWVIVHDHTSA